MQPYTCQIPRGHRKSCWLIRPMQNVRLGGWVAHWGLWPWRRGGVRAGPGVHLCVCDSRPLKGRSQFSILKPCSHEGNELNKNVPSILGVPGVLGCICIVIKAPSNTYLLWFYFTSSSILEVTKYLHASKSSCWNWFCSRLVHHFHLDEIIVLRIFLLI